VIPSEQVAAVIKMAMVPLGAVIMFGVAWGILRKVIRWCRQHRTSTEVKPK
jgi:hypothetical protein